MSAHVPLGLPLLVADGVFASVILAWLLGFMCRSGHRRRLDRTAVEPCPVTAVRDAAVWVVERVEDVELDDDVHPDDADIDDP